MKEKGLSILDALENLNTLVDANSLDEIEITEDDLLISHRDQDAEEDLYWVKAGQDEPTMHAIRETFRSVYDHLQHTYSRVSQQGEREHLVSGINTVMVLVGEAANKLEHFGSLFKKQVHDLKEYKDLQEFYKNRIIKESFHHFVKKPLLKDEATHAHRSALPEQIEAEKERQDLLKDDIVEEVEGVHLLNDLEVIKRDHFYELFYLKNEVGHDFYTYDLARTIKLACDFGEFTEEFFGDDPLIQIKNWEDRALHLYAQNLLKKCHNLIDKFYKEAMKYKEMEMVASLHNGVMALMLAANPRNMIRQFALKGCHLYFNDFLYFLRETLQNREYQKFLIYSAPSTTPFFEVMINLVQQLCFEVYTQPIQDEEIERAICQLIGRRKGVKGETLSEVLFKANTALTAALKHHPNGPVFKALDLVREEEKPYFDPLVQGNVPTQVWSIQQKDQVVGVIRIACPIVQESVRKAYVLEEFKTFLRTLAPEGHFLYFNFQDRTSWREHARSEAVEELSKHAEYAHLLSVATLAKETDFYHQSGPYLEGENADLFLTQLKEHLEDEATGYFFSSKLRKQLFPSFVAALVNQVHQTFFSKKKSLSRHERLDFIQLTYHLIELKIIELIKPNYLTLSSKDGLDSAAEANVGLLALIRLGQGEGWREKEIEALITLLFGPTLLLRERVVHQERFERLHSLLQVLESHKGFFKDFEKLYQVQTLAWRIVSKY